MSKIKETSSKVQEALDDLNKKYGKGTVIKVGNKNVEKIASISTASLSLNASIGIGGYPRGRIVEIYGPESSGKTTLCLHAVKEAQDMGLTAAIVDMEHALDLKYAKDLGINIDDLLFSQPTYGEEALNIVKVLAETENVGIIIVDSVAALVPKSETEGEIGDPGMAKQARMLSQAMRILTPVLERTNTLLIFTNQIRKNIGGYGNPEVTAGGEAIKFYASVRVDIRKQIIRDADKEAINNKVAYTVVKNKVGVPYKKGEFYINYGQGIDREQELVDFAVDHDIIKKGGAWYTYKDQKLQGEDNVKKYLNENPLEKEELKKKINELNENQENGTLP